MSIIGDLDGFYENCALMSIKTSNNQEIIDKLPFWKYTKLQKGLNKYLEAEAKQNGDNSTSPNDEAKNQMESMKASSSTMMNQMKSSMKMPKL